MARRKSDEAVADDLDGTVEGLALAHFEKEKAAYEKRTGEKSWGFMPTPLTRTPIAAASAADDAGPAEPAETEEISAEGEE